MTWIDDAINDYYRWLKERTGYASDESTGWSVINTPFIGLFNDSIDIYVKKDGDVIYLSDDGDTLSNLADLGINVSRSAKRKEWIETLINTFGVKMDGEELRIETTVGKFPQAKHNMLSAILGISDLELTASRSVVSMFQEEVRGYFDEIGLIYSPGFIMRGASGLESTFDFQVAGRHKETVIKAFGSLSMNNLPNFLFGWGDIKDTREAITGKALTALAIVDDREKAPKEEYLLALERKNAKYIPFSQLNSKRNMDFLLDLAI